MSCESTTAGRPSIEIDGLEKHFGSTRVLDRLRLDVERGELLVVLGDSGSGKSTLLKLIAGLDRGQKGTIRIEGADQARIPPHKRDVAMVFQDSNGYEHLTVRHNLELAAKSAPNGSLQHWVEGLKLSTTLNQKLAQLSGGELQRVAIARAMISNKSVVLLDEPLAHLNQSLREEIRDLILRVHAESDKTFVYVTHDSEEAFYLANRIAVLAEGKIQQIGSPRTVYLSSHSKQVARLLGQPSIDLIQVPSHWIGIAESASGSFMEVGLRSHDWKIQRIDAVGIDAAAGDMPTADMTPNQLTPTETGLRIRAWIIGCQWMGGRWLLELNCPAKIRITCESPASERLEQALRLAEIASCEKPPRTVGFCEATIDRSCIQVFGRGESEAQPELPLD